MNKKHIGSDFDDFLKAEGLLKKCKTTALKRIAAKKLSTPRHSAALAATKATPSPPSDGGAATAAMAGEEARFVGRPLSLTLSPLVPRGEREKRARGNLRGPRRSWEIALQGRKEVEVETKLISRGFAAMMVSL